MRVKNSQHRIEYYPDLFFCPFSILAGVICHYTDVFQVASHPTFESVGKSGAEQLVAFPFLILMAFLLYKL